MSAEGRQQAEAVAWQQSRHDLDSLVCGWAASVRLIVSGRGEDYYDDYYGYLSWREAIDEVVAALPEPDASVVRDAVQPADSRFRDGTFDDGGQAMSRKSFRIPADRWYWRRVPVRGPITRSLGVEEDGPTGEA